MNRSLIMLFALCFCIFAFTLAVSPTDIKDAHKDLPWTTKIRDFFAGKNDLIRLHPAAYNSAVRFTLTIKNDDEDFSLDKTDKIHIFFPAWWITDQQSSIECAWSFDDEKAIHPFSVSWNPIDKSAADQGPFLTLVPQETFIFKGKGHINILCDGIMTPQTMPNDKELERLKRQPNEASTETGGNVNNANDFGLVIINDNSDTAIVDRKLELDSNMERLPSSADFLLTVSSPSGINVDAKNLQKNKALHQKYHHAMCSYIKSMTGIKHCEPREESIGTSSVLLYTLRDPNIFSLSELQSRFTDSDKPRLEAFKRFIRDMFKLKDTPNISLHNTTR